MNKLTIGIADMKMARNEGVLITYALGSCIGICLNTAKVLVRTVNIKYVHLLFALRESGCLLYHNPV